MGRQFWARLSGYLLLFGGMSAATAGWQEQTLPGAAVRQYGSRYMVHLPDAYAANPNKAWPVIVFLHGRGEAGEDFALIKKRGLPYYLEQGNKLDAIVLAPQTPAEQRWHPLFVNAVMEDAARRYRFDKSRIYLTGMSMGGIGSWSTALAYPHRFAAMAPVAACLFNDIAAGFMSLPAPQAADLLSMLRRIKDMPTWIFHGDRDTVVPTELGQRSADLLHQAGGKPHLTIYPMTDHDSWSATYSDNPAFYTWLFAQRNAHPGWDEPRPAVDVQRYVGNYVDGAGKISVVVRQAGRDQLQIRWLQEKEEQLITLDENNFVGLGLVSFAGEAGHKRLVKIPGIGVWNYKP